MSKIFGLTVALLAGLPLSGCVGYPPSHEAFVAQQASVIGSSIHSLRGMHSTPPLSTKQLPNGNMEDQWKAGYGNRDRCHSFYEYDPQTSIITGWRFEGSKEDCISVAP